jgi:hypothetical protein
MTNTNKQHHSLDMQLQILDTTGGYTSDSVKGRYVVGIGNIYTGHRQGVAYAIRHLAYSTDKYGMWLDTETNTVYVDRVYATDDYELALMLGWDNGELAIYDREKCEEIRIDYGVTD